MTDTENTPKEIDVLKMKADTLGIKYGAMIGVAKLREKINEVLNDKPKEEPKVAEPVEETLAERNTRMRKNATRLVRIRLSCLNPNKKAWPGELFSAGNRAIGFIKKFVPFNADEGYHVPAILYEIIKDRKFQQTYIVNIDGKKIKKTRLVKEFSIEELPPLTKDEIKELAAKQALNNAG